MKGGRGGGGRKGGGPQVKFNPVADAGEVLLPGRHPCTCEASRHALVNNCLQCGRIVCEQEGSGPCYTCGHLVCSPKEQEQISRMSKAGCKLYNKLMSQETALQGALQQRDRLIEYDKTVERRTTVIDDQGDYFRTDSSWLSSRERHLLAQKKDRAREAMHGRRQNLLTFDFAGGRVVEEKPAVDLSDVQDLLKSDTSIYECLEPDSVRVPEGFTPLYREGDGGHRQKCNLPSSEDERLRHVRIQDRELQEMSDEGMCLSVQQPFASLLAAGVKGHEGRDWYTNHRGRLWIHAGGKVPSPREIADVQKVYQLNRGVTSFPPSYPTGCLIGCIDVVDCLPQEEYKARFPDGEIASPYVFICENAHELTLKFPMKGKRKIFKLESTLLQAAKKTLRKSE